MRASEIAELTGGRFEGGDDPEITAVAPLDRAGPTDLSFLAHPKYLRYVPRARAGALLVTEALAERGELVVPRIIVEDVHGALAEVLTRLHPEPQPVPGVHDTAVIGEGAVLEEGVSIGPYAIIGANARIGARSWIGPHVVVGDHCVVAEDVKLHPHVTLYPGTSIGARTIVHSGARLGVDGFGYVVTDGRHRKVPQVGRCVIGPDVEIGANSTIDRGSIGVTEIGEGVKIDNLVHIAHNVRIGAHSVIVAQVGIAGSSTIGQRVTLAGQVGVPGHVRIGDGATLAAQAGVFGDVPANARYSGYPARPHNESLRAQAALFKLPSIIKRIRALERALLGRETPDA